MVKKHGPDKSRQSWEEGPAEALDKILADSLAELQVTTSFVLLSCSA
jgi:hypothetical protein